MQKSKNSASKYNSLLAEGFELKPQQVEYIDFAMNHHYCMVGAKQGNGKTLVGIITSQLTGSKTVVVCPSFLRLTWRSEFEKFLKEPPSIVVVTSGKQAKKIEPSDAEVFIVSYSLLGSCEHLFIGVDSVVLDEAHMILNPKAKRTKSVLSYINRHIPKRLTMLTGTPNKGKGKQWYSPIMLCSMNPQDTSGVDLRKYHYTYWDFQKKFCHMQIMRIGGRDVTQFDGIKNVETLKKLLKDKLIVGKKVDHGVSLVFKDILVSFKEDKELQSAWESFVSGDKAEEEHMMSIKSRSAMSKVPFTVDYVSNLIESGEGPVVVFTDHLNPLYDMEREFKKKYEVRVINGATPMDQRHRFVEEFQAGGVDVLVATITSSNTGLTLTKAHNMVMNDLNWNPIENDQAYHRIFRIGQKEDCVVHNIAGSKTDKVIAKNLLKRQGIIDKVLEEWE